MDEGFEVLIAIMVLRWECIAWVGLRALRSGEGWRRPLWMVGVVVDGKGVAAGRESEDGLKVWGKLVDLLVTCTQLLVSKAWTSTLFGFKLSCWNWHKMLGRLSPNKFQRLKYFQTMACIWA